MESTSDIHDDVISKVNSIRIVSSEKFTEMGTTFQGHAVQLDDTTNYKSALMQLYKDPVIAKATSNMWALKTSKYSARDDDGEYSGSFKIAEILNQNSAKNCMIIVSKWHGGMQQQQRFSCIDKALKDAVNIGQYIWY